MNTISRQAIYIFWTAVAVFLAYLLAPILTPFIFGTLLAYLANPLVKRFEKRKIPHLLSVIIVFALIILIVLLFVLMLIPLIQKQINILIGLLPQIITWMQNTILPHAYKLVDVTTLETTLSSSLSKAGDVIRTVVASSYTIIEWLINLVLIPVVTFYLLRDWDKVCDALKDVLPKSMKATVLKLAHQCDEVLSAFFRGQLLIMLALCVIYGIGLSLIGLNVGFMIGIIGGILSIVPYLGSLFVLIAATLASLVQFGTWDHIIWVVAVFLMGQAIEGYVLAPYFVGQRIGLHPVMVIFAVMAGGALFGFFGVLVALPAAAVIKVLLSHLREKYT